MNSRQPSQTVRGVVVSDKMDKTRVIEIRRHAEHPLYGKKLVRVTRLFIHDEKNSAKVGDRVVAISTRPLSRQKSFRLLRVLEKRVEQ